MSETEARWVLAFDSTCSACQSTSSKVAHACDHRLEVMPLSSDDVKVWRATVYGDNPPWAPTLIRVNGESTQAWTGRAMAVQLVRAIGLRSTMRVLRVLGQNSEAAAAATTSQAGQISRTRFLKQIAVGGAVASGLVLFGRLPAMAAPAPTPEALWVKANLDRLPQRYNEIVSFDVAHRREIFRALSPEVRSNLWVTQLEEYVKTHPEMSMNRRNVVENALDILKKPSIFNDEPQTEDVARQLEHLRVTAIDAFGKEEGRALFTMLGPMDASAARGGCGCSCKSDWCDTRCSCCLDCNRCQQCSCSGMGCGLAMLSRCDGNCT